MNGTSSFKLEVNLARGHIDLDRLKAATLNIQVIHHVEVQSGQKLDMAISETMMRQFNHYYFRRARMST